MNYYFNKTIKGNFDEIIKKVTEELKTEGFGILTDINIQETLKKKLDELGLVVGVKCFSPENRDWFVKHRILHVPRLIIEDKEGKLIQIIQGEKEIIQAI